MTKPAWTPFVEHVSPAPPARLYVNSRYQVIVRRVGNGPLGPLVWLSIRTRENTPEHDWRDFQRIKNELVGEDAEGVELYPAEGRLVDTSNQFHLFVFERFRFPFGFDERLVCGESVAGATQRPFDEAPPGALSGEEMAERARAFKDSGQWAAMGGSNDEEDDG